MSTFLRACLILIFLLILGFLSALHGAETVKRFEFTSTLTGVEASPGDSFKGYLFGEHEHFVIGSDDGSIKGELDKLVGSKVRIIVYEVNQ